MLISHEYLVAMMLVIARFAGLFMTAPVLQSRLLSTRIKVGLIFWLSILVLSVITIPTNIPPTSIYLVVLIVNNFLLGVLIGFCADMIYQGIQFAGSLFDMQMGLSVAQSFDPMSGTQATIMSRMLQFLALILFFDIRGHHMLLSGVFESFKLFPLTGTIDLTNAIYAVTETVTQMFYIGLQLASPIILVIFLLDFSLGIISRVAPQVNVFQLGFQMKPALGLVFLIFLMPLLTDRIVYYLLQTADVIFNVFAVLSAKP